jgi:ABC-2 type transport system ATP-binding protein
VSHTFGEVRALDRVDLTVGRQERVALLGRNGSGKTTLLRIASTLLRPEAGHVSVCGHDLDGPSAPIRQQIGVVFQSPALDPALTAREALTLQAALVGIPRLERAARIADALGDADLHDRADDRVGTFSGGMARRLDLSRSLLHRPALALLDEPTTGLDPIARDAFWAVLDERRAEGAQIIATHLMEEAARCDRVVILDRGRVVADDTPAALTSSLGADALWLDTPDASALAAGLTEGGHDAQVVDGRVLLLVADATERVAELYARPDVRGVSIRQPTLGDVFAARVAS